jgi:hypothetical protein
MKNELSEDLLLTADKLDRIFESGESSQVEKPLELLKKTAEEIHKAWSGSCLGYHANVYYKDFTPPPAGAHFSPEWGLHSNIAGDTLGDWVEYPSDHIETTIHERAGNPDLTQIKTLSSQAEETFESEKSNILSLLTMSLSNHEDSFISSVKAKVEKNKILTVPSILNAYTGTGHTMSRDSLAVTQGFRIPPHMSILAEVESLRQPFKACKKLGRVNTI